MKNPVTKIKKQQRERRCCFSDSLALGIVKKKGEKKHIAKRFNDERICLSWV